MAPSMELSKYVIGILSEGGDKQAVAFPEKFKHADIWRALSNGKPNARAISAGFFYNEGRDVLWCGGVSDTMQLESLPGDSTVIQRMLESPERKQQDLRLAYFHLLEQNRKAIQPARPAISMA
jgi:hypothetical protein